MDTNRDYANLYSDVVDIILGARMELHRARVMIEGTDLVKRPTKKTLLGRIDNIFAESNAIVEKLGALGRVK